MSNGQIEMVITSARKHGFYAIAAIDKDGNEWIMNRKFKGEAVLLTKTLSRIREKMEINSSFWHRKTKADW